MFFFVQTVLCFFRGAYCVSSDARIAGQGENNGLATSHCGSVVPRYIEFLVRHVCAHQ